MKKTNYQVKTFTFCVMAVTAISFLACVPSKLESHDSKEMVLWYDKPAENVWHDGLVIGNGYMGGYIKN